MDVMMEVENDISSLDAPSILATLLDEFSAVTEYRALCDTLPRRLASLLRCRCVLLYQRIGETLQFASGSFADSPGWSAMLLAVAHINPIELHSDIPEARSWQARRAVTGPLDQLDHGLLCTPLLYRQRAIGILTAIRGTSDSIQQAESATQSCAFTWQPSEVPLVAAVANVVAMLLENARLLERDRERIHELSLLNSITGQMNCSLHEQERVYHILVQRTKEICAADLCEVLDATSVPKSAAWLPPELQRRLLQRWSQETHHAPLVLERGGESQADDYLDTLSPRIKTFFALPLVGKREGGRLQIGSTFVPSSPRGSEHLDAHVSGVIVGAYEQTRRLRREELMLLQVLANQAGSVLENIALMAEVVEARNESRRLLHRVLNDQRLKELILASIPSGLITLDMYGTITTFNRAAETVLGYHPREVLAQPVQKILALKTLPYVLQTGQPQRETLLASGHQGQDVALDVTVMPLHDDRGRQVGALATFADVTAMHHLEEEKRRLDRLASLGEMSANVAHEVRNPLAAIKTSMQMLRDDLAESVAGQGAQEEIAVVLKEVERLDRIVRDLLLFARPRQLHPVTCDLIELSERILYVLRPHCEEQRVRVRLARQKVPAVQVDAGQMEQVLMNLFLNALQAMPDGGILSISCQLLAPSASLPGADPYSERRLLDDAPRERLEGEWTSALEGTRGEYEPWEQQAWLELAVSDTGLGISHDALERIFQPFYTTKAHGIGLGLPITRRLIEDHHGYLLVESQLGYGTTMSVRLPVSLEEQAQSVEGRGERYEFKHSDC
jgi:PAS domain S-box-containing protein